MERLVSYSAYFYFWLAGMPVLLPSSSFDHGLCNIKLITAVIYGFRNKLVCLSVASLSSLV
jgi:hypothetical protein